MKTHEEILADYCESPSLPLEIKVAIRGVLAELRARRGRPEKVEGGAPRASPGASRGPANGWETPRNSTLPARDAVVNRNVASLGRMLADIVDSPSPFYRHVKKPSFIPPLVPGSWIPCECGGLLCLVHELHTADCPCPDITAWDEAGIDPYAKIS